jgi:hypothetical protein
LPSVDHRIAEPDNGRTPAVLIWLALEARPQVFFDCLSESEEARLLDWIGSHPELLELIAEALELRRAAT